MLYSVLYALVVDAETVDDGLVSRYSEASWLCISVLWKWSERSYLNESEAEIGHIVVEFTILVQSSCKSYRIRKVDSEDFTSKRRGFFLIDSSDYRSCEGYVSEEGQY